ncbi:ABC transporter permease [Pengzhenrongella phosphoraccumulans]|uniref:ABC transporter permease n=1 Tax=Pengzhenrongella phosphoraccumulans TaxID=3114394 RepID=UPI00388FDB17
MKKQLFLLNARELFRDRKFFIFAMIFPFGMLLMFILMGKAIGSPEGGPNMSVISVPMAIYLAVTGSGLTVTAGPLASLRKQGVLRLLGTTPVRQFWFIGMHLLVRVLMLAVQLVGLLLVAWAFGSITLDSLAPLFFAGLLCLVFFLAVGYFIGSVVSSPDAASGTSTAIQLGSLFASGLVLPFAFLPKAVVAVLTLLPTTFAADLLVGSIPTLDAAHPAVMSVLVVMGSALSVLCLAVWKFRWNDLDS